MSTRSTAKINSGSATRSSPGIYNMDPATMFSVKPSSSTKTKTVKNTNVPVTANTATANTATANTPVSSSKTRLLTVPVAIVSAVADTESTGSGGSSFLRYMVIIFILGFLGLTLFLYLEQPADTDLSLIHLYDPVLKYLGMVDTEKKEDVKKTTGKKASASNSGVNKLAKALDEKTVVNKIDKDSADTDIDVEDNKKEINSQSEAEEQSSKALKQKYKKKPVIPTPDEATISSIQKNKPKSKAGFCYIGEDSGIRSCIKVGEGDICMSGDIFPTQAICINPNLRE